MQRPRTRTTVVALATTATLLALACSSSKVNCSCTVEHEGAAQVIACGQWLCIANQLVTCTDDSIVMGGACLDGGADAGDGG